MASAPDDSPGFLLWHVTLRWQRAIVAALAPLDLTHVQFVLLASLWWLDSAGARPNQLELARQAGVDVKMTSQVLRKLEDKKLLVRDTDPADTRAKLLRITPAGASLAVRAVEIVEAADAAFFSAVPDTRALLAVLRPLAAPAGLPGCVRLWSDVATVTDVVDGPDWRRPSTWWMRHPWRRDSMGAASTTLGACGLR